MPAYKNKTRGSWYCSFYYTDWTGKRKRKKKEGFDTKRDAVLYERQFLERYAGTPEVPFSVLADAYLKSMRTRIKYSTFYSKSSLIHRHVLPYFGSVKINEITRSMIATWQETLTAKGYKPSYLQDMRVLLHSMLAYAVNYFGLSMNPASGINHMPSRRSFPMQVWTVDEFRRFAMTLRKPMQIVAFYLLFWTGMRTGELLALTWKKIDFNKNAIVVNRTRYRLHQKDYVSTPKTANSERVVVMPSFLTDILHDYYKLRNHPDGENYVIPCEHSNLRYWLRAGIKKSGVKKIRLHDLRHSHASLLINAGCPPTEVADRLGHANAAITLKVYSHMYESRRTAIAEKLGKLT